MEVKNQKGMGKANAKEKNTKLIMELDKKNWGKKQPTSSIEEVFKKLESEITTK